MDTPLEIVFHNMPSSPTLEGDIRKRGGKLDRLYGHLVGCRVSVEQLHRRHQTGNLYDIHIDMRVPGEEIVVSREPPRPREGAPCAMLLRRRNGGCSTSSGGSGARSNCTMTSSPARSPSYTRRRIT